MDVSSHEGKDLLHFKVSLIQLLRGQALVGKKAVLVARKKIIETSWKTVWILLEGWKCLSLQGSIGSHFWLHMCLNILWNRPLKACRNTHALPETIQGLKHFPFFPQRNSPCPHLAEKRNLSSKDNFAWVTG